MGLYDTFRFEGKNFQSKAFGRGFQEYNLGDPVQVSRAPFTQAEASAWERNDWPIVKARGDSYQVEAVGGSRPAWVQVRESKFASVTSEASPGVAKYDYWGRLLEE